MQPQASSPDNWQSPSLRGGPPHRRYHGLDLIRASMMLLGVVLHTALCFHPTPGLWLYQDVTGNPLAGFLVVGIHVFRMPIFFTMAGFFAAMVWQKQGAYLFAVNRFNRIVLPLVLGWFVVFPLLAWSISFAWIYASGEGRVSLTEAVPKINFSVDFRQAGPIHLWFLYYLVWFYGVIVGGRAILHRFRYSKWIIGQICEKISGRAWSWLLPPVLILLSYGLMLPMTNPGIDTPLGWAPLWHVMALYFFYFGVGWIGYRERGIIEHLKKRAWFCLIAGSVFLFLACASTMAWYLYPGGIEVVGSRRTIFLWAQFLQVTTVWFLLAGFIGVGERILRGKHPVVRYLVDASLWIYLLHFPLTILIPSLFRYWEIPSTIKMVVMIILVILPLLLSYHFLVRRTALGVMMQGGYLKPKLGTSTRPS